MLEPFLKIIPILFKREYLEQEQNRKGPQVNAPLRDQGEA